MKERNDILDAVYQVVQDRKQNPSEKSYVASLYAKGLDKILGKIGEEATEVAVAGKGKFMQSWSVVSACPVWKKKPVVKADTFNNSGLYYK
jgi:phosphoribosyl-ATP pyrophosphohydrolase